MRFGRTRRPETEHRAPTPSPAEEPRPAQRLLDALLVFFAALVVAVRPLLPGHGGEMNQWVQMCVFIAAMLWIVRMGLEGRFRFVHTGMALPAGVLLLIALVSMVRSPHKVASLATLLEWLSYALMFLVLANLVAERLDSRFVLRLLWASAFVVILYGLLQQFIFLPLLRDQILSDPQRVQEELRISPENYGHLAERARGRIFSTFLLANSLAGFLALVFPGFLGYVLDRLRAGRRGKPFLVVSALWGLGALVCLVLTLSKGGWLAFAVGMCAFCVLLGKDLIRRHARLLLGLGAGAVLAAALLFAAGVIQRHVFRDAVASYEVRIGYWRGALAMAREHPLLGVGLGTFGSNYPRYRWPLARAAQAAHNDYLQVLAELGILGLAAFLWLWVSYFRGASAPRADQGGKAFPPRLGYVAGILAFVLCDIVSAHFSVPGWDPERRWWGIPKADWDTLLIVGLGAAWVACFALLGRGEKGPPGELCRKGLVCGLIAFLFHMTGDFDYYEPGVAMTAWVVAALSVAPRRPAHESEPDPIVALLGAAGAFLATLACAYVLLRVVQAGTDRNAARAALTEAFRTSSPESRDSLLREATERYVRALGENPLDDSLRMDYGDSLVAILGSHDDEKLFTQAAALYQAAAALNPLSAGPHLRLGDLYLRAAELAERSAEARVRPPLLELVSRYTAERAPGPRPLFLPAVAEFEAAAERDPNRPSWRLRLAEAYERLGDRPAAAEQADRAAELNDALLRHHREHELSLRDEELTRLRALRARLPRK